MAMAGKRNRRIDKTAGRRRLRRIAWGLGVALGATALCMLLRYEASLPPTASMGIRLDPRALFQLELPDAEPAGLDWRAALRRPFLRLDHIHVFGLRSSDAETLTRRLGLSNELALIDVDPERVCEQLEATARIAACTALRIFPRTLAIAVRERTPVAVLEATGEGVASDGQRFELQDGEALELPRIVGDVERALVYVDAATRVGVGLRRIEARPASAAQPHYILWPIGTDLRILPGDDPTHSLLRYLTLMRARAIERAGVELDLRFRGRAFLRKIAPAQWDDEGGEA